MYTAGKHLPLYLCIVVGISTNPCSDTYLGSAPASEPETEIIQGEIDRLADDLDSFVTFHTAATMWLIPWGHSIDGVCVRADDHDEMVSQAYTILILFNHQSILCRWKS